MDPRLFRTDENPNHNYNRFDRFASRTSLFACRWLEFIGWYTSSVRLRLLGHYRLFQLYKKRRGNSPDALPSIQGYILQYRSSHWIKHYSYMLLSRIPNFISPDTQMELHTINHILVHQRSSVLYEFLAAADDDFENAFITALQKILDPEFINTAAITKTPPPAKELTGKEKGVFSKKQVLILLDLANDSRIDRLPFDKEAKQPAIARFLQALTGKSTDTWLDILKDYQDNDLYSFHTDAERSKLIAALSNISEFTYQAGLGAITSAAERKIRDLRAPK
ncbi:hypothetical protein [Puia sp.]|jgi:hypothetical protein|uniref:hypothetical protein n=1 Tax=Puia sp. TaxID=2045100 RepID=UPI002F3F81B0